MRAVAMLGGLLVAVAFAQACSVTTDDGGVVAMNRATGEIREFDSDADVPDGWVTCDDASSCPDPIACGEIDEAACLVRTDCAPIYDDAQSFVGCVDGGVQTCTEDQCGPQLGMPSYECWDGSIGGPTGRCIESDGGCGWEIRDCPAEPACDPGDCGPAPGMPNWTCDDGSIGGPACVPAADGTCGWAILECPEDGTCDDPAKCGPDLGMPAYLCDDGSTGGNTGRCLDNQDGTCSWEIRECPEAGQGG